MQRSSLAQTGKDAAEAQARLAESSVRELHATKLALHRDIAVKSLLLQASSFDQFVQLQESCFRALVLV